MSGTRLSVVTVNWNGGAEVVANLARTAAAARRRGDVEIIVVDNASSDASPEAIEALAAAGDLRLVRLDHNSGFGPASNRGATEARSPLVLFLNPDARPEDGDDPFEAILAAADSDPAHSVFCPLLTDAVAAGRREAQESFQFRRLPTPGSLAREFLLIDRLFPRSSAKRRARYADVDRARPFEVEQPAAAALAVRRELFLRLGGFDERFVPAWWEDVDLAMRLARAGERIVTVPGSRFVHRGGSSIDSERGLAERDYRRIYGRNLLRFASKWWGPATVVFVRVLLAVGGVLRLLLAVVGARGDRPRRVTVDAARGTISSAFSSIGGGR